MSERRLLRDVTIATRAHVEWLRDTGIDALPPPTAAALVGDPASPVLASDDARRAAAVEHPADAARGGADDGSAAAASLPDLRAAIGDCHRCKLAPHRTNLVFGVGNPRAELVFVGEAPGRDEDLKGEPFVGRAGQLLTEIIEKGMKLRREDVYIANIIKCRPPQNRNPEPDEIASCEPFLVRQLEIIGPKVIVALGTFAAQALLKTRTPITRLRGSWVDYHGIPLMPTFHPAYLLRNPAEKRVVWQDIQQVMERLGLPR